MDLEHWFKDNHYDHPNAISLLPLTQRHLYFDAAHQFYFEAVAAAHQKKTRIPNEHSTLEKEEWRKTMTAKYGRLCQCMWNDGGALNCDWEEVRDQRASEQAAALLASLPSPSLVTSPLLFLKRKRSYGGEDEDEDEDEESTSSKCLEKHELPSAKRQKVSQLQSLSQDDLCTFQACREQLETDRRDLGGDPEPESSSGMENSRFMSESEPAGLHQVLHSRGEHSASIEEQAKKTSQISIL